MEQTSMMQVVMGYLPIILIFGVFYFMVLRPQSQAAKAHAALVAAVKRGDEVLMASGLMAKVDFVEGEAMRLRINAEDTVLMAKGSIERLLNEAESKQLQALLAGKGK